MDYLVERLKENGYKVTEQRKAILKVLNDNVNNLMSADKIFTLVNKINEKANISTVYRNLEILEDLKLIFKVLDDEGVALYKIICSEEHHHHLICKNCGKIQLIDYCPVENLKNILDEKGFHVTNHKLELYGYCKYCNKNRDKR